MWLDDADAFLTIRRVEADITSSTTWLESCAVAGMQFFRHMARCARYNSFHLKYLQLCTRILVGTDFSTHVLKTAVMHLLMTISCQAGTGGISCCCWMIGSCAAAWRRNASTTSSSARKWCLRRWSCLRLSAQPNSPSA